jgi:hypothetical protein
MKRPAWQRPVWATYPAAALAFGVMLNPVFAGELVAGKETALCKWQADLDALETRVQAKDAAGVALYLKGAEPPCIMLDPGETVEQLDQNSSRIQVVTRRGVPRFIGWGDRSSFGQK